MSLTKRYFRSDMKFLNNVAFTLAICATTLSGCKTADMLNTSETLNQGYVVDQETLALAPVGSSREQVLLSLGTPSTTATFDNEVFYYISQKRQRPVAFMKPKLVDQSILAVYFDKDGVVSQLAHYTLQDGKVFDMISRTTPTGGKEMTFLGQLLSGNGIGKSMAKSVLGNANNK
ncbi:outer membrane protein assembly factor BamE [Rhizobium herbae]|nr:outer membrane protein assembly factor BamE [Rhizobium herbae]